MVLAGLVLSVSGGPALAQNDDFEREPINYSKTTPDNALSRLQQRLDSGKTVPVYEDQMGYLRWLLRELQVPESSQMLVFSKTSVQRQRIAPKTPRAIYSGSRLGCTQPGMSKPAEDVLGRDLS